MKALLYYPVNLRLFDEGAGGEAGAGTGAAPTTAIESGSDRRSSRGRKGENVIYGKQEPLTQQVTQPAAEVPEAKPEPKTRQQISEEFEALIKGEYKDAFTERSQKVIDRRFRASKEFETTVSPILEVLSDKYGTSDPTKLLEALNGDAALFEQAAEEQGLTVEQYRYMKQLERDAERNRLMQERQQAEQQANQTYNEWIRQADELKGTYPGFDLSAELRDNPEFAKMLKAGVGVKTAYEVSHVDDIKQQAAASAAKQAETNAINNIRKKGSRPTENGAATAETGVIVKSDVSKLTKADRAAAVRQAMGGRTVMF